MFYISILPLIAWKLHKITVDKALYRIHIEIALKYTKMTKSRKTSKTRQKVDRP